MAKDSPNYYALTLRRGESKSRPFIWGPRDKSLPRYNLTGKAVEMRIKPKGGTEIVYAAVNPGCYLSDAANGQFTINPTGAMVAAYTFQNAEYAVLIDGERVMYGDVTITGLYD